MIIELLDLEKVTARGIRLKGQLCRGIRLELHWRDGLTSGSDWILN